MAKSKSQQFAEEYAAAIVEYFHAEAQDDVTMSQEVLRGYLEIAYLRGANDRLYALRGDDSAKPVTRRELLKELEDKQLARSQETLDDARSGQDWL